MSEWPQSRIDEVLNELYGKAIKDGAAVFEDWPSEAPRADLEETFPEES